MGRNFEDHPQRCLPIEQWPPQDRRAWVAGTSDVGGALTRNRAADWRPHTRRSVSACYGRWLTFLTQAGELDKVADPAERLKKDLVAAYIERLRDLNRSITVGYRIHGLYKAMSVIAPDLDTYWLRGAAQKLIRIANQEPNKYANVRPIYDLLQVGLDVMAKAERASSKAKKYPAIQYRDGLIIALLAYRPFRISNLAEIRIGKELSSVDGTCFIRFRNYQTKSHREVEVEFPRALVPNLARYMEHHRNMLLDGNSSDSLWIGLRGKPFQTNPLCSRVTKWTSELLGERIGPHYFRHSAATTIAKDFPERLRMASALLGHEGTDTTTEHYVHAGTLNAGRKVQAHIAKLRREL